MTTAAGDQAELNHVLDFTVRAPTFVFGLVVLAIAGLLIYVLQLMRMLERQEDVGLLRGLGSGRAPLVARRESRSWPACWSHGGPPRGAARDADRALPRRRRCRPT